MSNEFVLETTDLTKTFNGFAAVSGVNLRVRRGSIHALIGPNGAGKTTVFNLLTKFLPASSGTIRYRGENITHETPAKTARRGIVRSFQISATFPHLSVLHNVRIALQRKRSASFDFWRSEKVVEQFNGRAMELLGAVGLEEQCDLKAVELPYGQKRALELATTLALEPELMLLDEPTQGMGHEDVGRIVELIRKAAQNRTVLMVEHNLSVVSKLCDTITVLQRGSVLAEGDYQAVSADPRVREAYLGKEVA